MYEYSVDGRLEDCALPLLVAVKMGLKVFGPNVKMTIKCVDREQFKKFLDKVLEANNPSTD